MDCFVIGLDPKPSQNENHIRRYIESHLEYSYQTNLKATVLFKLSMSWVLAVTIIVVAIISRKDLTALSH